MPGRPWRLHPSKSRFVASPRIGHTSRPNRAIDGRGLSPPRSTALLAATGLSPPTSCRRNRRYSEVGTQEPYLSRSPAWPELKEQETKHRGSITHRIRAASGPKAVLLQDQLRGFSGQRVDATTRFIVVISSDPLNGFCRIAATLSFGRGGAA
jgi:hypothetical protein